MGLLTLIITTCQVFTIDLRDLKKVITSVLWRVTSWYVSVFKNLFHIIISQIVWNKHSLTDF